MRKLQEILILHLRATLQFYPRTRKGKARRQEGGSGHVAECAEEGVEEKIEAVGVTGYR